MSYYRVEDWADWGNLISIFPIHLSAGLTRNNHLVSSFVLSVDDDLLEKFNSWDDFLTSIQSTPFPFHFRNFPVRITEL